MASICLPIPLVLNKIQRIGCKYFKLKKNLDKKNYISRFSEHEEEITSTDDDVNIEIDEKYLKSLDPKEWKDQDHYAVLGLKNKRINASDDDIRRAYRKIVLLHHPDKRKAKGEEIKIEDDYFTCITKAYETLGNTKSRRSYDSIDPEFDDALPTTTEIEKDFYGIFNKYFNLNARWSERKNVPIVGDENSTREEVDKFYTFWYDFESWREFSYLDEEDKEKGQDRDERRWIEKQNKILRIKRKKEEMSRIRALVDLCYNNDPRILKFKKEEKEKKLAAKRAKMDAAQAAKAEEERVLKEAKLMKEKLEQAEQKRIEQVRIEKEQQKKLVKKERKIMRDKAKELKYFTNKDDERVKNMENVEKLCELLKYNDLQNANKEIAEKGAEAFFRILNDLNKRIEEERLAAIKAKTSAKETTITSVTNTKIEMWNNENVQLLIKSVNLFPAGTAQRWEVIASFMNQHSPTAENRKFTAKEVLNKAKNLQSSDFSQNALKQQANQGAFESFEKQKKDLKKIDKEDITVNNEVNLKNAANGPNNRTNMTNGQASNNKQTNGPNSKESTPTPSDKTTTASNKVTSNESTASKAWTKEEQALLEQAIKTYPMSTPDRWDRIAECVPNRNKKDCLRRVKELVELVNAKKAVQNK